MSTTQWQEAEKRRKIVSPSITQIRQCCFKMFHAHNYWHHPASWEDVDWVETLRLDGTFLLCDHKPPSPRGNSSWKGYGCPVPVPFPRGWLAPASCSSTLGGPLRRHDSPWSALVFHGLDTFKGYRSATLKHIPQCGFVWCFSRSGGGCAVLARKHGVRCPPQRIFGRTWCWCCHGDLGPGPHFLCID